MAIEEVLARENFNLRIKAAALEEELILKKREVCKLKIKIYDLEQEILKLKIKINEKA